MIVKYKGIFFKKKEGGRCHECCFMAGRGACKILIGSCYSGYYDKLSAKERFFLFLKQEQLFYQWDYERLVAQNNGYTTKKIKNPVFFILHAFGFVGIEEQKWNDASDVWHEILRMEGYL